MKLNSILVAAVLAAACVPAISQTASMPPAPGVADVNRLAGQTEPAAKVEVPSVSRGRIADIPAREGQAIKKGQVLARMDTAVQEATVNISKAKADAQHEIKYAKVQLEYAKTEWEKYKSSGASSAADLRAKELAVRQAEAYLAKTEEQQKSDGLSLVRDQLILENMTIKSPIDGFVHRINKQAGEAIDENQTLAVVVQTTKVHASFFLPEQFFGKVKAGDKVTIELATTPPLAREATLIAVDPYVDPAGHLFRVKMELDNADGKIPVGIAANWVVK